MTILHQSRAKISEGNESYQGELNAIFSLTSINIPVVSPGPMREECMDLLEEFKKVFDPVLPLERADMEAMRIAFRDEKQPPNAFRGFTSAVQSAMELNQLDFLFAIICNL